VADGVAVEKRGKPAVTIVADDFARGAEMKKRSLGMPDLSLHTIIYPRTEAEARAQAQFIASNVAEALVARPDPEGD
jgi:hypothetical protein